MFCKMRRFKQELSKEECIEILKKEPRGVLSVLDDNGYPYGIPMNHWYDEESGKLYFHGAKTGHKLEAIKNYDKVSFCVYDNGYRNEGEWALNIKSVVVFGRMSIVTDSDQVEKICTTLCKKFTDDPDYAKNEWLQAKDRVLCLELSPEHMTGKRVKES